jgi:predicted lipoprotein with Yx(FWY)xxD motif
MRTAPRLLAVAAALLLLGAACGDDDDNGDETAAGSNDETTTTSTAQEAGRGAEVAVADTDLGSVLVDAEGKTLYVFDNDQGSTSSCEGGCATTWPPLATDGEPTAGEGVDAALLGTTERSDGTTQVTYDGHPLYTYNADTAAGDTNGQGVGGIWWVVAPDGQKITGTAGGGSGGDSTTTSAGATGTPGY